MIFISHSDKDQAPFTSLCLALKGEDLPYWNPKSMKAGASLRDQLRDAISKCDVCIFMATRSSVNSKWCLTETGAFGGAGKRIILYSANPDIEELPPLFQGDLWIGDAREVIRQVKEELAEKAVLNDDSRRITLKDEDKILKDEILLLKALAERNNGAPIQSIEAQLQIPLARLNLYLGRLLKGDYVRHILDGFTRPEKYHITQKGREYLDAYDLP